MCCFYSLQNDLSLYGIPLDVHYNLILLIFNINNIRLTKNILISIKNSDKSSKTHARIIEKYIKLKGIKMKKIFFLLSTLCSVLIASALAYAHEAHEHGAANMYIVVDGALVHISMESPLANLLSFEHAPATPEQGRQVQEMARRMHEAQTLFQLSSAAKCRLEKVTLASAKIDDALFDPNVPLESAQADSGEKLRDKEKKAGEEAHGDLDAEFSFICAKPENLNSLDILLFSVWPKLHRVEVQAVTPKGQRAAGLTPQKHLVTW